MGTFTGEIVYKDDEKIEFEINQAGEIKFTFLGEFQYECQEHLKLISRAIIAVKLLLETSSPEKFEMQEA